MNSEELYSVISRYVEENIGSFHKSRIDKIASLKLNKLLSRKNPYLFKAKNVLTSHDIVKSISAF